MSLFSRLASLLASGRQAYPLLPGRWPCHGEAETSIASEAVTIIPGWIVDPTLTDSAKLAA